MYAKEYLVADSLIFFMYCIVSLCFRMALKGCLILLPLLGVTWLLGFLQANLSSLVMSYAFVLLNSSQVKFSVHYFCYIKILSGRFFSVC